MNTRNRAWRRKKNFSKGRRKKHIAMAVSGTGGMNMTGSILRAKSIVHVLHVVQRRIIMDMELQETTHIQTLQK